MPRNRQSRGRRTFLGLVKKEAKKFCLNTTLHGYRFIVLPKRILLERVLWIITCLTSLVVAVILLCEAWYSFQQNPTVLLTDSNHHAIWHYHFPAVTVCDYNKISKKKAFDLARNLTGGKQVEHIAHQLRLMIQLTKLTKKDVPTRNYSQLQGLLDEKNLSVDEVIRMLGYTCKNMLKKCMWKGEEQRCESIFEQVKTSDGFCCSFNYFALKNHNFSGISTKRAPKVPRRVSACGYQTGLEVLTENRPEDYFASYTPSIGQKIVIHNPYYYPDWSSQAIFNPQRTINSISISPTTTYCSEEIKGMDVEKRNCLFPDERQLLFFKHYTFRNCMVECRMNVTKKLCNCYPYQYVHTDDRTASCLPELDPLNDHTHDYKNLEYRKNPCGCLADCESTEYVAESSSGILVREFFTSQPALYGGITLRNHSIFRVFFNDLVGIRIRRDVQFNWHTLLAYYGGLLGFFLGFSFVSGIEIVYFFTIKLILDATRESKKIDEASNNMNNQPIRARPIVYQELNARKIILHTDAETTKRSNHPHYVYYLD